MDDVMAGYSWGIEDERKRCAEIVRALIADPKLRDHVAAAIETGAEMTKVKPSK